MAYLNNFLESWRKAINEKYPKRSKKSDGTIGDRAHSQRKSEHNPDSDGTIDAFDCDVNLLGSSNDTGSAAEDAEVKALIKEFLAQPEAQLVIYNSHIYNVDIQDGKARWYGDWSDGKNPHDHHIHFQSKQSREDRRYKGDLDDVVDAQPTPAPKKVKAAVLQRGDKGSDVKILQRALKVTVDGEFGILTEKAVRAFQKSKGLTVDGTVGPRTQAALKI